jgi:hypothetical protein
MTLTWFVHDGVETYTCASTQYRLRSVKPTRNDPVPDSACAAASRFSAMGTLSLP